MRSYDSIPDIGNYSDKSRVQARDSNWLKARNYQILAAILVVTSVIALTVAARRIPNSSNISFKNHGSIDSSAGTFTVQLDDQKQLFDEFALKYGKMYSSESEYASRFEIFKKNLAVMQLRAAEEKASGGLVVHGITKFADLSQEEFESLLKLTPPAKNKMQENYVPAQLEATSVTSSDWRNSYVTAIKSQGACGSVWAFAAIEQLESDSIRLLSGFDKSLNLSPQQLIDCDTNDGGCNGGWMENAWNYIENAGGVEFAYDYPITGTSSSCTANSKKFTLGLSSYTSNYNSEAWMQSYVLNTGPLTACMYFSSSMGSYAGGIITTCDSTACNMAVQLVGINTVAATPYWIVSLLHE